MSYTRLNVTGGSFHFLLSDLTGVAAAFALFSLLAFFPGYAICWVTNLFDFRGRLLPFRLAVSTPVSLAVCPIASYTVGRWFGLSAVWVVYGALFAAAFVFGAPSRERWSRITWFTWNWPDLAPFLALIAAWLAIAFLSLADLPLGRRLYYSIIDFDYSVRIAFTHSLATFGLPARNPFFFPGHPADLRYHYFWMLPCALVYRLGAPLVNAREAFLAGTMWVGIGVISLIPLYLRLFASGAADVLRRSRIGIALLAVTGLDIVPALLMVYLARAGVIAGVSPSVEWWNEQVDGWLYTMLWEPHYASAAVACFTGFLIYWVGLRDGATDGSTVKTRSRRRAAGVVLAGLAFASAAGCGIYVALVFAVFLGLWLTSEASRGRWLSAVTLGLAGVVAAICIAPFFASLRDVSAPGSEPPLLQPAVRAFAPVDLALRAAGVDRPSVKVLADLLSVPLNYFMELGVFFVTGGIIWMRRRSGKRPAAASDVAAVLMMGTSVAICTFVKSSIIANNDLGWRGFLPAQFMLLLFAADVLAERVPRSILVRGTLLLGVAGVAYDLAILRFYPVLSDAGVVPKIGWLAKDESLGLRTAAAREAYEWLRARTPEAAIVQPNPDPTYQDTFFGAYAHRQAIALGGGCGTTFGGDRRECSHPMSILKELFAGGGAQSFQAVCRSLPIDFVVAADTDESWRDRSSWVWTIEPVFRNRFIAVFPCR